VHLGSPSQRLTDTLLPVWNYTAITAPLGERLAEAMSYPGAVSDTDGIDHFRVVGHDRLMWANPSTTWQADPRFRRDRDASVRCFRSAVVLDVQGAFGQTVHGMPQIGQLRKGLWVASGFGRHGLNTTAMAGMLIARSILWGDERWRLFSPFELVWAGGHAGWLVGRFWQAGGAATPPLNKVSRYHERTERH
jgi:glycine/D-amino acid oxidase-like deaminating enzyme